MLTIKLLAGFAFIGSIVWFVSEPNYEPAIAIASSLSALLAALIGERRVKQRAAQNQSVAQSGMGIQAGGDVNIGRIHTDQGATRDVE